MGKDHPDADLHLEATGLAAATVKVSKHTPTASFSLLILEGSLSRMPLEIVLGMVLSICAARMDSAGGEGNTVPVYRSQPVPQATVSIGSQPPWSSPNAAIPEQATL